MTKEELIADLQKRLNQELVYEKPGDNPFDEIFNMFSGGLTIRGEKPKPPQTRGQAIAEKIVRQHSSGSIQIHGNTDEGGCVSVEPAGPSSHRPDAREESIQIIKDIIAIAIDAAIAEERERDAKLAEQFPLLVPLEDASPFTQGHIHARQSIAAAIRNPEQSP